jgi:hypothetical protein
MGKNLNNMNIRKDRYRFYELSEGVQEAYIGQEYPCSNNEQYDTHFVGVRWDERSMRFNYYRKNGLIFFTGVSNRNRIYFNVGVFSPDDWDYTISIDCKTEKLGKNLRKKIIRWMKETVKQGEMSHEELFDMMIEEFNLDRENIH